MADDFKGSIYDQMRKNEWRTAYLFLMFPIIILGLTYLGLLIYGVFYEPNIHDISREMQYENKEIIEEIITEDLTQEEIDQQFDNLFDTEGERLQEKIIKPTAIQTANDMMNTVGFWVIIGVIIWSFISYFLGHRMILGFAGAKPIQKKDNPELYRVVENASIAAGLPKSPDIYIINDNSLNAFATGRKPSNSKVAISKGLLATLEKRELEAVMAHEIGHIINRDIRVMLLAITLAGAIEMVGEILIRTGGRGSGKKGGNPLPLIGILFLTIGVLIGTLTRFAISREREYLADSTSAHLTSNPNALATALEKIAHDSRIEILDKKASMAGLCIADPSERGHKKHAKALQGYEAPDKKKPSKLVSYWRKVWSTHPPIMERIRRLRGY